MNQNMKQNLISNGWDSQQQLARNLTGYNVPSPALSQPLVEVLSKAHQGMYDYPLSFTQGIVPVCSITHVNEESLTKLRNQSTPIMITGGTYLFSAVIDIMNF